jgi:hypothetical protein
MYVYGSYIFLNEINKGIHIINNTNPANPVNETFIAIPGCEDLAVKGSTLYADCFMDMMVLDISNPADVKLKTFVPNLFPHRRFIMGYAIDSNQVIVDWLVRDTTVSYKREISGGRWGGGSFWFSDRMEFFSLATNSGGSNTKANNGKGGSMARFAIRQSYLYAVTTNQLLSLSIAQPQQPVLKSTKELPWGIETIYPFKDKLFIGSNSGMFIFSVSNPENPELAGTFSHARVCDPVIADDDYAFVTLRSGTQCQGFTNQMDVVKIDDIYKPALVKSYPFTNPHGLDKDGNYLFVCDGSAGLKVLDATNVQQISLKKTIALPNTFDVICWNKVAIVSTGEGLYQYDIRDINNIYQLSFMGLNK